MKTTWNVIWMGKYFHELLQILVNWYQNLRININEVVLYLLRMMLVRILAWMGISDKPDDEFGICLSDS